MTDASTVPDGDIAVGVPMFQRKRALTQFLESVPKYVSTVYIADNGKIDDHADIYDESHPFEITVIDIEYDKGIGACRRAIADRVTERYIWIGDNDMYFIRNTDLRQLRQILEANGKLGGVSGWLFEQNRVRSGATNLQSHNDTVLKASAEPQKLYADPAPYGVFDMIPQAGLFRREVFDTYTYDAKIHNTEHFDFFYGHKQAGEWGFASTPSVLIGHAPNIDRKYRETVRGDNPIDMETMQRKWGIEDVNIGSHADWVDTRQRSTAEAGFDLLRHLTPLKLWLPIRRIAKRWLA